MLLLFKLLAEFQRAGGLPGSGEPATIKPKFQGLVVEWPPPERSWWRRAHRNASPVLAILEDSALVPALREWDEIVLKWEELGILPMRWKSALSEWWGIYFIFDASEGKGYVGSAYGESNLLGRWMNYAVSGRALELRDAARRMGSSSLKGFSFCAFEHWPFYSHPAATSV